MAILPEVTCENNSSVMRETIHNVSKNLKRMNYILVSIIKFACGHKFPQKLKFSNN